MSKERKKKERVERKRRGFLKKITYSAPALIVLGSLTKPTETKAAGFGSPPSDPNG